MDSFETRIEKIVAGGHGLARHAGRVVFVPDTAPGERHRVEIVASKKDFARARSIERLETSPFRREPPCPYYERCGGCALMHLAPAAQLEAKKGILHEALERSAGPTFDGEPTVVPSPELEYRNRLRFHAVVVGERVILGFRRRGSHEVVDIDHCLLGARAVNAAWRRVRRFLRARPLVARHVVSVELADSSTEPGRLTARFVVRSPDGIRRVEGRRGQGLLEDLGVDGLVIEVAKGGPLARFGRTYVEHHVLERTLRQSVGSFFQTNRFLLEDLVAAVVPRFESEDRVERALDLFCGVGLFTLPLSRRAESVLGVESSSSALADAKANAARAGAANVRFRRSDASRFVARGGLRADDVVVVDPPRGGLDRALVEGLGRSPLRALRYVSCDPPAFARDASALARYGFSLRSLALLDLFPNTHLFESVAVLSRAKAFANSRDRDRY